MASITRSNVFVLGSFPAFLSALKTFTAFFVSLSFILLSCFDKLLNSAIAAFTLAGSGSVELVKEGAMIAAVAKLTDVPRMSTAINVKILTLIIVFLRFKINCLPAKKMILLH